MQPFKIPVRTKRLRDNAILPNYKHVTDSGADLYVANIKRKDSSTREYVNVCKNTYTLAPFETILCQVGFAVEIPDGFEIQIRPTSGNALFTPFMIANSPGTIDSCYRGEIGVIVKNVSLEYHTISVGDKIAQMVINPAHQIKFEIVETLSDTDRGNKGFGSTGVIGGK